MRNKLYYTGDEPKTILKFDYKPPSIYLVFLVRKFWRELIARRIYYFVSQKDFEVLLGRARNLDCIKDILYSEVHRNSSKASHYLRRTRHANQGA